MISAPYMRAAGDALRRCSPASRRPACSPQLGRHGQRDPGVARVGSSTVQPGFNRPSASAPRSWPAPGGPDRAGRLRSSSLAHSRTCGAGENEGNPTSGVSPTACSRTHSEPSASGLPGLRPRRRRRQDGQGVAVGDGGLEPPAKPHVSSSRRCSRTGAAAVLDRRALMPPCLRPGPEMNLRDGAAEGLDGLLSAGVGRRMVESKR